MKYSTRLRILVAVAAVTVLLVLVLPAFAGGWAVVTLDALPTKVVAGESLTVGFVVRQHGDKPLGGLSPKIRLQKAGETESKLVPAKAEGGFGQGHYTATLTFPSAGVWQWSIETGFWPERQPMPDLTVAAGDEAVSTTSSGGAASSATLPVLVGVAGLIGAAGGLFALVRTKAPWAVVVFAGLASGIGFASATVHATASEAKFVATVPTESQVEQGRRLFIAKGCVVCHTHDAVSDVKRVIDFNMDEAPNLTDFTATPNYLAKWLDDPASLKPKTYMPQLNLSDDEIGALVEFINAP